MPLETSVHSRIIAALGDYASRFHTGNAHEAASPLGAWMLLAIMAPLTDGGTRAELERTLGCSADEAREFVAELLDHPHPIINAAAAAWLDPRAECDVVAAWRTTLARAIETGRIPTQAAADAWADRHTSGAIKQFPLTVTPLTILMVASALAVKAKWEEPYPTADASQLGITAWRRDGREVREVIFAEEPGAQVIATTEAAGDVGVLMSRSIEGLLVVSVIAAPDVATASAVRAAHEVAALAARLPSPAKFRSLYDMPLGKGHAWHITERREKERAPAADRQHAQVYIPAWRTPAKTNSLLDPPARGFEPIIEALRQSLPPIPEGYEFEAAQTAVAEFNKSGFSAAAVSAFAVKCTSAMGGGPLLMQTIRVREAIVRFARPFAVVAVATTPQTRQSWVKTALRPPGPTPWRGLPIFSAWITEPCEIEEQPWR